MIAARHAVIAAAIGAALMLAGCAPLPPVPGGVGAPPSVSRPKLPGPHAPASTPQSVVPRDSMPSAEALELLGTIPEPLRPGEQVAPAHASEDSSAAGVPSAEVPVPEPTQALGERRPVALDSTRNPAGGASPHGSQPLGGSPTAAGPGAIAAPPTAPSSHGAAADTCWRVQILAPLDPAAAEQARATAASQLLLPIVIEREQGRYKVRSKDCMTRTAADLLRRRAIDSGFAQAFRISSVAK